MNLEDFRKEVYENNLYCYDSDGCIDYERTNEAIENLFYYIIEKYI